MNISNIITQEVASVTKQPPTELPALYHTVDPEALGRVLESLPDENGYIKFRYADCHVTIDAAGDITVQQQEIPHVRVD